MAGSGSVKVDARVWAEVLSRVSRAGSSVVRVGVIGAAAAEPHPSDPRVSIGEVALIHEFGSEAAGIPERSFVRSTMEREQGLVGELLGRAAESVVMSSTPAHVALGGVGKVMAEQVQRTILDTEIPPPLAPATIAKKGDDHPLLDSGALVGAISSEVVRGGATDDYDLLEVAEG